MLQRKNEQGFPKYSAQATATLEDDLALFLVDCRSRGLAEGTMVYYRTKLGLLYDYFKAQGIRDVRDVTPAQLRQYLLQLSERHNPGGVRCAYRVMRTFFRWYELEYEPQGWSNPILKVKGPKCADEPLPPVPMEDLELMLATCKRRTFSGDRDRAMLLALLDTGCRASEFSALDVGDVDAETGAVMVRQGKGGKSRITFIGAKCRRELLRYLRHRGELPPEAALWATREGTRLTYSGLRLMVKRRARKAGVPVPSLHAFRRAFALLSLRNGADVYSLQHLLGHADLTVLRRYLAQTTDDLQETHARTGPVDHWRP